MTDNATKGSFPSGKLGIIIEKAKEIVLFFCDSQKDSLEKNVLTLDIGKNMLSLP